MLVSKVNINLNQLPFLPLIHTGYLYIVYVHIVSELPCELW